MHWKRIVGWVLVVYGVIGIFQTFGGATNSYGIGQLTGAVLFLLGGIWLIRSAEQRARTN
jgi:hypothetical protein